MEVQHFLETLPAFIIAVVSAVAGAVIGTAATPRVVLAQAGDGIPMRRAFELADARTNWFQRRRKQQQNTQSSSVDDNDALIVGGVALLVVFSLYLRYTEQVAAALLITATSALVATTIALVILAARDIVAAGSVVTRLILIYVLGAIAILGGVWLLHPPLHPEALEQLRRHGIFGGANMSFEVVFFQMLGALGTFVAAVTSIFFCLASTTAAYIASGALGSWLWRPLYWTARWTVRKGFWIAMIVGALSLALTSGALANAIPH